VPYSSYSNIPDPPSSELHKLNQRPNSAPSGTTKHHQPLTRAATAPIPIYQQFRTETTPFYPQSPSSSTPWWVQKAIPPSGQSTFLANLEKHPPLYHTDFGL